MQTIETTAIVTEDGKLVIVASSNLPVGRHRVLVVIDERPLKQTTKDEKRLPFQLPAHNAGLTDNTFTFRREDLYDD